MAIKRKNTNKKNYIIAAAAVLIALFDLLLLFYVKYRNQGLPFSDFNISLIGNILNLSFTFILVLGIILYTIKSKNGFKSGFLISFTGILNISLFAAILSTQMRFPLPNIYFLDHPLSKIFIGALFSLYQFLQFVFMSILWYSVIGKELIILRAIVNSVVIVVLLLGLTFVFINLKKNNAKAATGSKNSRADKVAVVLGAAVWSHNSPSPSLSARVDKAYELYKKKIVNKIQLTGSNAPGEMSEAEVAYNYLTMQDINHENIWQEKNTVSTSEQVRFIHDSLATKNNIGRIIVVSDAYHLTRVREISKFYKVKAGFAASSLNLKFEHNLYYKLKESIALLVFWFFAL